jgi:hypothetical protein
MYLCMYVCTYWFVFSLVVVIMEKAFYSVLMYVYYYIYSHRSLNGYTHVLHSSSNNGKSFLPRMAAMVDASPLTDVIEVIDHETFKRPMYAGNAITTVKMTDEIKFLLIRSTTFEKVWIYVFTYWYSSLYICTHANYLYNCIYICIYIYIYTYIYI